MAAMGLPAELPAAVAWLLMLVPGAGPACAAVAAQASVKAAAQRAMRAVHCFHPFMPCARFIESSLSSLVAGPSGEEPAKKGRRLATPPASITAYGSICTQNV